MKIFELLKNASFIFVLAIVLAPTIILAYGHYYSLLNNDKKEEVLAPIFFKNEEIYSIGTSVVEKITESKDLKDFKTDAVKRGKAHWIIDENGETEFEWIANATNKNENLENTYINEIRALRESLSRVDRFFTEHPEVLIKAQYGIEQPDIKVDNKSVRFGPKEYNIAKKYEYDIEEYLMERVNFVVSNSIYKWDGSNKTVFLEGAKNDINASITKAFDGFETYYRIYEK